MLNAIKILLFMVQMMVTIGYRCINTNCIHGQMLAKQQQDRISDTDM